MAAESGASGAGVGGVVGVAAVDGGAPVEATYEVRWDDGQRLFRVWNPATNMWVSRPGFADERIARVVAGSLGTPAQTRGGTGAPKR